MNIPHIVRELLVRHNCVVIPDFGGFVASVSSAHVDTSKGIISPPEKKILFNKNLINNDGLLIHRLVSSYQTDYEVATNYVSQEVSDWKTKLYQGEKIVFEQLGTFYLDQEQTIQFEQDRFFNLLLNSFGLSKVTFIAEEKISVEETPAERQTIQKAPISIQFEKPLETKEILLIQEETIRHSTTTNSSVNQDKKSEEAKIIIHPISKNLTKKLVKYVAAACLLPIAFYSVWIPVKTDVLESGVIFKSDFNPFHQEQKVGYEKKGFPQKFEKTVHEISFDEQLAQLPQDVRVFSYEFADDFYIPVRLNRNSAEKIAPVSKSTNYEANLETFSKSNKSSVETGNLKVIVGSFSSVENAENLVSELKTKGFNASVLTSNDKIRVCAGTGSSATETSSLIKQLSSENYQAWVLR